MSDRELFRPVAPIPPKGRPGPVRFLRGLLRSDFSHFSEKAYRARVYSAPLIGRRLLMPTAPEAVRKVLVDQADLYPKSPIMARLLGPLIGESMFVTNGAVWRRQRRMVEPTLELSRLKDFFPLMTGAVADMVARFDLAVAQGEMDVDQETMRVTADILCRTVFSEQVGEGFVDELSGAFRDYQALTPGFLACEAMGLPYWIMPLRLARGRRAGQRIRTLLSDLIHARVEMMKTEAGPRDLLSAMIRVEDAETGHRFSERELTDEVAFFFLAGHETSASALSWTLYLLANDQSAQDRARAEISEMTSGAAPDFSALRRLRFTRDVFREALRLYPPVASFIRQPTASGDLGGCPVHARDVVAVTPWFVHRSPRNWSHPDRFDPDRFQTVEGRQSMRGAYLPFNVGPRVCSGASFATQEAMLILAALLSRFRFEPAPGKEPQPAAWLTHRSRNGVQLRVSRI